MVARERFELPSMMPQTESIRIEKKLKHRSKKKKGELREISPL